MIPTLEVAAGWDTVLDGAPRAQLEQVILPDYLRQQRWFGGKGRRIEAVRVVDCGTFPAGIAGSYLVLLDLRFTSGESDRYFVPLGLTQGSDDALLQRAMPLCPIARLRGPRGEALLHDALADDDTCTALLGVIASRRGFDLGSARVCGVPTAAFGELRGDEREKLEVRRGRATSSNTLIFYGRRLMLKVFRRLEAGINPDYEIGRFLTEETRFDRIPRVAGALEYHHPESGPTTLAILQELVPNDGDGWHHAVDELGRYYERASPHEPIAPDDRPLLELAESMPPEIVEVIGSYLDSAATLGRRTAEMHLALASKPDAPDFAPEPFTAADDAALRGSIRAQAHQALAVLQENIAQLPDDVQSSAEQLLDQGPRDLDTRDQADGIRVEAARIRCHGDYHLGQVLRIENDYVILDFEGEPARSLAQRRAKQSPLKDVAGMLRSYHYAAYAGLFAATPNRPADFRRLEPWAELWFGWVSAAFLRAYRSTAHDTPLLPAESRVFAALLDAFMLDKAFYELNYELNNRPDWVRIPLRGILTLLSQRAKRRGARRVSEG
jgi:maltose alpha-D-glucosyltransferase/alpha-amylase